jgi:hypothetical protein
MRFAVPFLLLPLAALTAAAGDFQPSVRFLGDLRVRAEVDARDFDLSSAPNTFTILRTRFGVEASPAENIKVFILARDSRVFGTETDATGSFNTISDGKNLDLHQGYVEITKFLYDGLTVRLGRQELSYANERMVGAGGWGNVGRSFDGGLVRFGYDAITADIFGMNVAETEAYPASVTPATVAATHDEGQYFFGLYLQWKAAESHEVNAYALYQGNHLQSGGEFIGFRRTTVGGYAKGSVDAFIYEAEGAYQAGERGSADISAHALTGSAGYRFSGSSLEAVTAGLEYLSGTPSGGTDYSSFDPPYPTAHKFHGFMDYFTNIPAQTGERGLVDFMGRVGLRFGEALTAGVWYHNLRLAEGGSGGDLLGDEFDVTAKYQYAKALSFEAGASAFLPGPLMRDRFGGADAGLWGYFTVFVSF